VARTRIAGWPAGSLAVRPVNPPIRK